MSVSLTDIESKVRYIIGDYARSTSDEETYTSSTTFTLSESNPVSLTAVYKNDVEMDSGDYSFDSTNGKVTITGSLTSGDNIELKYNYYPNYSSTEIESYIQAALVHISANNYNTWIVSDSIVYPEPSEKEENLIAIIASLVIDKPINSYRLPDITLNFPNELPLYERISKTISIFKKSSTGIIDIL